MANESYSNNPVSPNIHNLVGYFNSREDSFRIINKSIASWSFNGAIPSKIYDVQVWNPTEYRPNIVPGDFVIVLDQLGEYVARPVIIVEPEDPSEFFDITADPATRVVYSITGATAGASTVTYTTSINHNFTTNTFITVSDIFPAQFNTTKTKITAVTNNTFTVSKSITGSYTSGGSSFAQAKFNSNLIIKYLNSYGLESDYIIPTYLGADGYPTNYVEIIREDWENKYLGSSGWILSGSGNSIFNNVAIRGEITADTLDVGGGEGITYDGTTVRLGTDVTIDGDVTATSFSIDANNYWNSNGEFKVGDSTSFLSWNPTTDQLSIDGRITAQTLNVGGGQGIVYDGSTVTIGTDVVINSDLTVSGLTVNGPSSTLLKINDNVSDINNLTAGTLVNDGLYIDRYNYWYTDGRFSVGNAVGTISFTTNTEEADTSLRISDRLVVGTNSFSNIQLVGGSTAANTFIRVGTGGYNTETARFFVDGNGRFSLGQKLRYTIADGLFVEGAINATSGTFTNTVYVGNNATASNNIQLIGTSTAATTAIGIGTGTLGYNTTATKFWADASGRFSLGQGLLWDGTNLTINGSGTFSGSLSAASGSFTGALTGGTISIGSGNSIFKADSNGIYLGNATFGSAPFRVSPAGEMIATNATISGTITATTGAIGGFKIGTANLYTPAIPATGITAGITSGTSNYTFFAGADSETGTNAKFSVTNAGALTATSATVSGAITATSGSFTGTVNILTGGSLVAGTTTDGLTVSSLGLVGYDNGVPVFTLPTSSSETPTIANFKLIDTAIVSDGQNANIIVGTTGSSASNITIRGQVGTGIVPAIFTTIAGTATTDSAGNGFYIDRSGKFRLAGANGSVTMDGSGNLTVTGTINASLGNIGGFTIGATSLTAGTGSTSVGLNTTGYPFYAGNAIPGSAPFSVTSAGALTATNATITGAITATSGSFTGAVNATSGTFLNTVNIGNHATNILKLTGTNTAATTAISSGTSTYKSGGIWMDASGRFSLGTEKLFFDGTDLTISGALEAGTVIGSTIRGSDVFANSAQIGGNAYGWIAGAGGLFSGTKESTSYLQSGFYSNEILDIVQETQAGSSNIKRNLFLKTSKITSAQLEPDGLTIKYVSDNSFYKGETINITGAADSDYNGTSLVVEYALSGEFYVRRDRTGITPTSLSGMNATATSQTSVLGRMTGNSRSPYITFANDIKNIEIGYELWAVTGSPTAWNTSQFEYIGIVAEIVNSKLIKLRSAAPRTINNENFAISYVNSTITMQFFSGLPTEGRNVSIETPGESEYAMSGIFAQPNIDNDKIITTKSLPPIFVAGTYTQKQFSGSPCFLSFSTGSRDNVKLNIKRISALKEPNEVDPESPFYNVKVYIDAADEEQVSVGDNILLSNIPVAYELLYSLNNNYFPIISMTQETVSGTEYAVLEIYADGYLSFSTNPSPQPFTSYDVSSYEILNNTVTLTLYPKQLNQKNINSLQYNATPKTYSFVMEADHGIKENDIVLLSRNNQTYIVSSVNGNTVVIPSSLAISGIAIGDKLSLVSHRFEIGQVINIPTFNDRGYIDNDWTGQYVISAVPASNKISYQKVLPNSIDQTVPGDFDVIASSYPAVEIYNNTKNYAMWVGAISPDEAPFSIDTYGQNLKVKNIEVTGEVKGFYSDIIELDDFSGSFDGRNNAFEARYNQKQLVLDNPLRLVISLNGVVQSAFIQNREYVWQSGLMGFKGYTVDNGRVKFAESPPHGSIVNARVFPGPQVNKKTRIYPFKAVDVALG